MQRQDLRITTAGGAFDCYCVTPAGASEVPGVVLASAVHGVTSEIRRFADELAGHGYVVAAPDLFWRSVPGPLSREDKRAAERSQPRAQRIREGEADLVDSAAMLREHARVNGRLAVIGFCYGGPYAILGTKRLGYDAGLSFHGTNLGDYVGEIEGIAKPLCIIWGDRDFAAPAPVQEAYRSVAARMPNVEVHILPGVDHGYTMPDAKAYDAKAREFSIGKALGILARLR